MGVYITRRVIASLAILLAATFLMFALMSVSGDPLADLRTSSSPDKELLIQARIDQLNLDQPMPVRYVTLARRRRKVRHPRARLRLR